MNREIVSGVYWVGAIDWNRRLFDELIPLPKGTSYNSYLIKGKDKIALIDTVDPTRTHELVRNLKDSEVDRIDFIIANHAEQNHSGSIPEILKLYPGAKVVTNGKCKGFLMDLLHLKDEDFIEIKDGDTLQLGDKTLEFIFAPWVHWPETMLTYLREEEILFPCDLFGSHLATSKLFVENEEVYESAKRYYAEIMMPFRNNIKRHLEKLSKYKIKIIAPSHGPVYREPNFIINAYTDWVSDNVKNEVVLPYVSMHGSVEKMVDYFISALMRRNITVKPFNLTKTDIGELSVALVDAATIVLASPMVLSGPHPAIVYVVYLTNLLRPKLRYFSIIGSYGWGGRLEEIISGIVTNLKVEVIKSVMVKGLPGEGEFHLLDKLADEIVERHSKL